MLQIIQRESWCYSVAAQYLMSTRSSDRLNAFRCGVAKIPSQSAGEGGEEKTPVAKRYSSAHHEKIKL
ncbi:hypothetical protein CEXT_66871 [Caerostris extrusa]|uniref:Uncharacterized protein n=1 Tax=Caerostris extrusa TaxID=172846 RepID=A0AAV4SZ67_CAEEX|nr:hypothetical protein CEXT_66871 [Caerostris extrusa]